MSYLKLLRVTFRVSHFDDLMARALGRTHTLRVCNGNGYSVSHLRNLFKSLIMSLFIYCIRVWDVATYT